LFPRLVNLSALHLRVVQGFNARIFRGILILTFSRLMRRPGVERVGEFSVTRIKTGVSAKTRGGILQFLGQHMLTPIRNVGFHLGHGQIPTPPQRPLSFQTGFKALKADKKHRRRTRAA